MRKLVIDPSIASTSTAQTVISTGVEKNDCCWQPCKILIFLLGPLFMTSSQAVGGHPAAPLRGPDFVLDKVVSWVERPGADAELVLRDGSPWKLRPGTKIYETQRDVIARAVRRDAELFLSGDKSRGFVDTVVNTRRLAAQEISTKEANGRYSVLFRGPPSLYHLRMDRPWSAQALLLLRRSASSGASFNSPDLLVAIDPGTSEIMAVKPLDSHEPGVRR